MKITDIKIRRLYPNGRMRAVLSVTFDHALVVHDLKVIELDDRTFVAMPSRRDENGHFRDIVHPIHADMRAELEQELLDAYHHALQSPLMQEFTNSGVAEL